jgi:hypothetical protein
MKQIERFLNHLYYAVYLMTAWLSFEPTKEQKEYERSLEQTWLLHGLSFLYIFDVILLTKLLMEYVLGYDVTSILGNSFLYYLFFFSIFVLIDFFIFHHFVYKGKKYLDYCREFEKESRTTKILWQFLVLLLYIIAIILLALIFFWGHRGWIRDGTVSWLTSSFFYFSDSDRCIFLNRYK